MYSVFAFFETIDQQALWEDQVKSIGQRRSAHQASRLARSCSKG